MTKCPRRQYVSRAQRIFCALLSNLLPTLADPEARFCLFPLTVAPHATSGVMPVFTAKK